MLLLTAHRHPRRRLVYRQDRRSMRTRSTPACSSFPAGAIGAFASLDLFFFYAFHELALIPTFLLIGIWGSGNRQPPRGKSRSISRLGSFILLLGLILLYRSVPERSRTFDMRDAARRGRRRPDPGRRATSHLSFAADRLRHPDLALSLSIPGRPKRTPQRPRRPRCCMPAC